MSKKLFFLSVAVVSFVLIASQNNVYANVFASDVRVTNPDGGPFDGNFTDGTKAAAIAFVLNENATNVRITISDESSSVVRTIDTGPQGQGHNVVFWHGEDDDGNPVPPADYTFDVTAEDTEGHSGYDVLYARSGTVVFTRGGTTIRNPAAPNFGHPIGGNGGGAGLKRGPLNFFADGTGFENFGDRPEVLERYSPFDVRDASGNANAGRLFMLTSDDDGWLYYSDRAGRDDVGNAVPSTLYRFASSLDPATLTAVAISHNSEEKGHGIDVVGTGAGKTIYWGLANTVVRMPIGEGDTFDINNADTVAVFGDTIFIKDIVLDDSGFMYVALRRGSEPDGTNPGEAVERYDISGGRVTRNDAQWSVAVGQDVGSGRPIGFGIDRGEDLTSNTDDRIYFSSASGRDGLWNTIRKIDDLAAGGSTVVFIDPSDSGGRFVGPPGGPTSSRADMSVDAAGNLIWFENNNEWIIAVSPPDGSNSFTTPSNDAITVEFSTRANAFPSITHVEDVPDDQGNQVLVSWSGSFLDRQGSTEIDQYEVYRKVRPGGGPGAAVATASVPPGEWELVGATSARQAASYNLTVATIVNERPDDEGPPALSIFYVSAVGNDGTRWDSGQEAGVSVDNLIPEAPTNVLLTEGASDIGISFITLAWDESPDLDFKYFAVLRGTSSGFDAGSAVAIGTTTDISFIDDDVSVGSELFYRIVAFDFNGNRGEFSEEVSLLVTNIGDAGGQIPTEFALKDNYPNPFNPETNIVYDLASSVDVRLQIFNMRGQLVKTLVDEQQPAGTQTIRWNGRNDFGTKVASGTYVYVLRAGDFAKSKRMTLLK